MKSTINLLTIGLSITILLIITFISCNKETIGTQPNGVYIVPVSTSQATENRTLLFSSTPYEFKFAVGILRSESNNINVSLEIDNSLVETYNKSQSTDFATMPEGSYGLSINMVTIPGDSSVSEQSGLIIKSDMLEYDKSYLLPIKIATLSGTDITLNPAMATKYYIIRVPTPEIGNLSDGKNSYWKNPSESFNPGRGNDGNTDGVWGNGSVCESGAGDEQYWEVDLGAVSPRIDTIRIWNRTDCCDTRTSKFYVFISDEPFTGSSVASSLEQPGVYQYYDEGKAGRPTEIYPEVSGRYIRLQNTTTESLTLAELTAIGIKP